MNKFLRMIDKPRYYGTTVGECKRCHDKEVTCVFVERICFAQNINYVDQLCYPCYWEELDARGIKTW